MTQRAGADENHVAWLQLELFAGKRGVDVGRSNRIVGGQLRDIARGRYIEQDSASDDRRNRDGVALEDAEVAAPVGLFEAVIPVVVVAGGDMTEAVDLRGDVVVDEERVAVPTC